jgi:hypothetical protein
VSRPFTASRRVTGWAVVGAQIGIVVGITCWSFAVRLADAPERLVAWLILALPAAVGAVVFATTIRRRWPPGASAPLATALLLPAALLAALVLAMFAGEGPEYDKPAFEALGLVGAVAGCVVTSAVALLRRSGGRVARATAGAVAVLVIACGIPLLPWVIGVPLVTWGSAVLKIEQNPDRVVGAGG